MTEAQRLSREAQETFANADREGRDVSVAERRYIEDCLARAKALHGSNQIANLGRRLGGLGNAMTDSRSPWATGNGGPGDQFVASQGWKSVSDPRSRGQSWSTGPVEVSSVALSAKGTLLEGAGSPGSGSGGGLIPVPQVAPGIVTTLFAPLSVEDVFASAQANGNTVRYMVEGTATNAAAGVAEGGDKPQSALGLSTTDEAVRKVATTLALSDEIADDAPAIQSYINSRLGLFVSLEVERQLLRGSGSPELAGLIGRAGVNTYTRLAADDNAVSLARVIANTRGSSFVEPDTVIMHPSQWLSTRLLRDGAGGTIGNFYGAGPFGASYGGNVPTGLFSESLWGKRVVLSTVVGAGTAVVGSFGQAAQIWARGGPTIEVSNSHSDWFTKDLVAVRCERRLALAVYRPSAFTVISGLA